ncbi:MAG: STAS domain-containing protein [Candidatus Gracilibacteria bacterium]|jgi:anti-anti-sigma factor
MTEVSISIENSASSSPDKAIKIVHIAGQLDESNVDEKIKEVYKVVEETPKNLTMVFDMEKLEYMNSKSIGYITDLYGKLTESGGKVLIAAAKPNILDILQVVGLTQLITTYDTIKAAVDSLGGIAPAAAPAQAASAPAAPAAPAANAPAAPQPPVSGETFKLQ